MGWPYVIYLVRIVIVTLTQRQIILFQHTIFLWWKTHKRDLPWRRTHDPYRIMVSEVMLQQTQVLRVIAKYAEFIEAFPTVRSLAQTSPAHVLRVWKGMGYNRRALYLHRAAKMIVEKYNGKFPVSESELVKLPGLGKYTARAILVFACAQEVPLVDTNIRQIITHFFFSGEPQKESVIEEVAGQLVPPGKSWQWHQALMDYGALELKTLNFKLKTVEKRTKPFIDSNRFYRGRIIDRLREGDMRESKLADEFKKKYGKSNDFLKVILQGLEFDGLISRSKTGIITLPE